MNQRQRELQVNCWVILRLYSDQGKPVVASESGEQSRDVRAAERSGFSSWLCLWSFTAAEFLWILRSVRISPTSWRSGSRRTLAVFNTRCCCLRTLSSACGERRNTTVSRTSPDFTEQNFGSGTAVNDDFAACLLKTLSQIRSNMSVWSGSQILLSVLAALLGFCLISIWPFSSFEPVVLGEHCAKLLSAAVLSLQTTETLHVAELSTLGCSFLICVSLVASGLLLSESLNAALLTGYSGDTVSCPQRSLEPRLEPLWTLVKLTKGCRPNSAAFLRGKKIEFLFPIASVFSSIAVVFKSIRQSSTGGRQRALGKAQRGKKTSKLTLSVLQQRLHLIRNTLLIPRRTWLVLQL